HQPERPEGQQRKVECVLAGVVDERGVVHHERGGEEVALGVLDREDVRVVGQPQKRVRDDRGTGAAGDVVEHDRQVGRVGGGTHVRLDRRLRRLRIVGGDDEDAVGSRGGRAPGEVDGVGGDVVAGAGDDLRPVADHAAHDVEQFDLLV